MRAGGGVRARVHNGVPFADGLCSNASLRLFQDVGQVQDQHVAAAAAQAAADIHQATSIGGDYRIDAGAFDERCLVFDHGPADGGEADRERAAEAAAFVKALQQH